MKAKVNIIVKDPSVTAYKEIKPTEEFSFNKENFLLDGPVSEKVAVLDFDETTGQLVKGAVFKPLSGKIKYGSYEVKNENDLHSRDFQQVSVFGIVLKTIYMFEEADVLGRPLTWAFKSPQLLVVPRAGEWANAFYERESHSLQFFYFNGVYTCNSQDIVSHETAHAILDGIAPDLYNSITPQSLALHEAIADLTAVLMACLSDSLSVAVLEQTNGHIEDSRAFSGMAEQFQETLDPNGQKLFLRDLLNNKTLNPNDKSTDKNGDSNVVRRNEPHDLSEVLSGALYSVFVKMYNAEKIKIMDKFAKGEARFGGKKIKSEKLVYFAALWIVTQRFKRMIFRALDYLPPSEISFADYGRAIIAADQASHPDDKRERNWIREEFVKRGIIEKAEDLNTTTNFDYKPLEEIDLEAFVQEENDWLAYQFAEQNREFLRIPKDAKRFRVRQRLDVTKKYYKEHKPECVRECIFKVSWDKEEKNAENSSLPEKRRITVGTTLAIDWETKKVRSLLTSDSSGENIQSEDRNIFLEKLLDDGILRFGHEAIGANGKPLSAAVRAEVIGDVMRVRSSAKMLHISSAI
jgi:hypothetical protein